MEQGDTTTAFDPLAALEAEYAAVLAQSRPSAEASASPEQPGDVESAGSDSEDEESTAVGGYERYELLPSSPCNSDDEAPESGPETSLDLEEKLDGEEDAEERPQIEEETEVASTQQKDTSLHEDKRQAIMRSMLQVKLRPPPWAQAANLSDVELVDMVQMQLGFQSKST